MSSIRRTVMPGEALDAIWEAARSNPVHQDAGHHPDLRACDACGTRHDRCSGCGYAIGGGRGEDDVIRCCIRMEGRLRAARLLVIRRDQPGAPGCSASLIDCRDDAHPGRP